MFQITEPGQHKRKPAIGIDLGTTYSLVSISKDKQTEIIPNESGSALTPSVMEYGSEVVSSVKRLIGHSLAEVPQFVEKAPYKITEDGGAVTLHVGGTEKTPVDVSADILKKLKAQAEASLGDEVLEAVITVPAYFNEIQRQATKDAAKQAGLTVLRLISEPTAAALAYGLDENKRGLFMVYDLGGGTFDVSILKLTDGVFKVVATGGDTFLGGDDFDHAIADKLGCSALQARMYKEELSKAETTSDGKLSRTDLAQLAHPLVDRTLSICHDVLFDADIETEDLDGLVLVGGSTRMPVIKSALFDAFGAIISDDINPDEVVARGAALQAEALTSGKKDSTLLLDVTPLSLGLETMGGLVEKIIDRNTPIPIAKAQDFTTHKDNQTGIDIHVLQGERETVDACRSLAKFTLKGIPPQAAGMARVRVTFSLDADGLLTVTAKESTTGVEQHVDVVPSYGLSSEEMVNMLKESYTHAKEDVEERQIREARVELECICDVCDDFIQKDDGSIDLDELHGLAQSVDGARMFLTVGDLDDVKVAIEQLEATFKPFSENLVNSVLKSAIVGQNIKDAKLK